MVRYQGRDVKAPESRPIEVRDAMIHLGGKGTVAAFTVNLRGSKPGEIREFKVSYPEDYPQESLAGKTFDYRVEVVGIKQKVVPPIDDELAKSVSELETLSELRGKLRGDLKERRKREVEARTKQKLMEKILEAHELPVPETLVELQLDHKIEKILMQFLAQGIDPRTTELDWRKIREESRPEAEKQVRASLILERIAEAEKIEVTEEELDETIRDLAEERRETPVALKTRLTRDGSLARIQSTRRSQKTLDFVYSNAKITRINEEDPARIEG